MEIDYIRIIESIIVIVIYLVLRFISFKIIDKTLNDKLIQKSRGLIMKSIINTLFLSLCALFILLIWGIDQSRLAVFIGSVLTVVGVAFFAQWSILSNITSSFIIFFKHPVKLNDHISILEAKDYEVQGEVIEIGLFFITLETKEKEILTLPNNIFIQKSIKKMGKG
ncbi:mechanosensitive ion channel [Hyunsoonleella sp. SJ7]|uniref:Mechanosensitive ion channel n=1 Tax=Hyunsoonleella aquatilis TaxID=2762758 RepID=A0A923H7R4_9FLAO|nr:mechanosensitive ion channel domain-containing protein [Hyunsoonleella aquatilis]MBC3757585.1 mechanosensitive ion channel [Hyunsoonleella aquatilis]